MNTSLYLLSAATGLAVSASLAQAQPALTIYNQNFAVVRDSVVLNLQAGANHVQFDGATALLEPDSVVLRDPSGAHPLRILEQNYRADAVSQAYLLSLCEGKTIEFRVQHGDHEEIVLGKVIRSGYSPGANQQRIYDNDDGEQVYQGAGSSAPLIEVNGRLRFSLPGEPQFTALPDNAILKPTLDWTVRSDAAATVNAELAYVTGGMNWEAAYNLVAPPALDATKTATKNLELSGLVTLTNKSGKSFENAALKLMAGDVSKLRPDQRNTDRYASSGSNFTFGDETTAVTQKKFEEYHLYSIGQRTTLRDKETKQIEFLKAPKVQTTTSYIYDGLEVPANNNGGDSGEGIREDENYGTKSNSKVGVMCEFVNNTANGLGIPLPKGRLRFYQRDTDGQLEFVGENTIDHTPQGETVKVYTGNAFDIVGNRKRTSYKIDREQKILDESFAVTLRNRKTTSAEVRVQEHLYRGANWTISAKSNAFVKSEANNMEFRVQIPANGEKVVTYTVHYTW